MTIFSRIKIFQLCAAGIFLTFMGLLVLVSVAAYLRQSGSTRQDMAEAQFIRYKAVHNKDIKDLAAKKTPSP